MDVLDRVVVVLLVSLSDSRQRAGIRTRHESKWEHFPTLVYPTFLHSVSTFYTSNDKFPIVVNHRFTMRKRHSCESDQFDGIQQATRNGRRRGSLWILFGLAVVIQI